MIGSIFDPAMAADHDQHATTANPPAGIMRVVAMAGAALLSLALWTTPVQAQALTNSPVPVAGAKAVTVEHIKVHGASLEGNLAHESADRDVLVVLPPGYARHPGRHYPVVYALHGYSIGAEQWTREIHVPQTIENAFAKGARPMIVVFPDSKTVFGGSMYSGSPTVGDFETFIQHDLVAYIDAHYRTLPDRLSRGLVGHSMGGYGATRIGMKHPDVFSALYIMSPCCLSPRTGDQLDAKALASLESLKSAAGAADLPFMARATLATAAAWSPDPARPPFYFDLPTKNSELQPDVLAKWTANAPLVFIDQYIGNLRRYGAIAIDVGDQDGLRFDARKLHEVLDSYRIGNSFTIYPGTHVSNIAFRFQDEALPFFSKHLKFEATP
jgi:enterochelin esterase-like enzyme